MKFQPKTEEELDLENMIPDGIYDFEVISATDKQSKAGNDMMVVELRIFTDGQNRIITDYLLEKMGHKLRHFCAAMGVMEAYNAGNLAAENIGEGMAGKCQVGTQKAKAEFSARNTIVDYIVPQEGSVPAPRPRRESAPVGGSSEDNSDLPF